MIKTKNIVISGTNFWNPGDDFVREGVIKILRNLFPDYILNFLFYNFNQDFFPQNKFSGIHNMISNGDLNLCAGSIDFIVIAGLSAGSEIKDLYNWIIENGLEKKVIMIGAGYENDYVDKHIYEEPELTIFKNAKVIIGRTAKTPEIIKFLDLPYHHINCPAILSVNKVKNINKGKKIENIAFSIQLPHGSGIPNHSVTKQMYQLSLEVLLELYAKKFNLSVIAHHKSEYFHFLEIFEKYKLNIPIIFSSFYEDLFNIYPLYDLVITTRLHSSLFANGFGIPGIIVNDTDRHTHTLDGFPHSVWINTKEKFDVEFRNILSIDLQSIVNEADLFKKNLMEKYSAILSAVLFEKTFVVQDDSLSRKVIMDAEEDAKLNIISQIKTSISNVGVKKRVYNVINKLTEDYWLKRNKLNYQKSIEALTEWFDTLTFLNWYAYTFNPENYLEVGVRRGRSLSQVVTESPLTKTYGFDLWIEDYSCIPDENIITTNPGPDFVISELEYLGAKNLPVLIKGDSHKTLPEFFNIRENPKNFDLILIDGDHSYEGAKADLLVAFDHLKASGAIVFDDISHVSHPELKVLWNEFKEKYQDFLFIEDLSGNGTGIAIKPPFDKYIKQFNIINQKNNNTQINKELPIHFFTIVLNGKPFIEYHINIFKELPFKWHWHIIEGVADLVHDTAWSIKNGGKIISALHDNGLSNDGTSQYIDELKCQYKSNITIYRKNYGELWDGKIEMVNAPISNINEECLLWQVDVDEFWKSDQIIFMRDLFMKNPRKTAAYYYCRFFVGKNLLITTKDTYGNHSEYEWLRTWHFKPGLKWTAHEPPILSLRTSGGDWINIAKIDPFLHKETEKENIIFDHLAYVLPQQIKFKEIYYGYENAYLQWERLQNIDSYPVYLKDYFQWVNDNSVVEKISENISALDFIFNSRKSSNGSEKLDYDPLININLGEIESDLYQNNYALIKSDLFTTLYKNPLDLNAINDLAVLAASKHFYNISLKLLYVARKIFPENKTILSNIDVIETMANKTESSHYDEINDSFVAEVNEYLEMIRRYELDNINKK